MGFYYTKWNGVLQRTLVLRHFLTTKALQNDPRNIKPLKPRKRTKTAKLGKPEVKLNSNFQLFSNLAHERKSAKSMPELRKL